MTPHDEKLWRDLGRGIPAGTVLKLAITADPRSAALAQFCERLSFLVPQVSIAREDVGAETPFPLILLPNGVRYQGVPQGNEVPPFVEALAGTIPPLPEPLRERVNAITHPAALEIYVTPHCTHCPQAVRRLMPLPLAGKLIRLTVIDGSTFPELAERQGVRAVPTAVLDGSYRWTGAIDINAIIGLMATRDPATLGVDSLEMMLKAGSAKRLSEMMAERKVLFAGLLPLLRHDQWPVRLGAMVAVEELFALSPDVAQQVIDPLWRDFEALPDAVKGDMLYLLGEIGGAGMSPKIRGILTGDAAAEVKEAAQEALEKLEKQSCN